MTTIDRQAPITPGTFAGLEAELERLETLGAAWRHTRGWTSAVSSWGLRYRESHYRRGTGLSLCGLGVTARRLLGAEDADVRLCPVCLERCRELRG